MNYTKQYRKPINTMKFFILAVLLLVLSASILAQNSSAYEVAFEATSFGEACVIMSSNGFLPDTDCDGVHDAVDNCPFTPNAPQEDSNRDGVGDNCDVLIEEVSITPNIVLRANEFFTMTVMLLNNQPAPLYNVNIRVENKELNYDTTTDIPILGAGQEQLTEFLFKIPRCTKEKSYTLRVTTKYFAEGSYSLQQTTQDIKIVPGGECQEPVTKLENTLIETFFSQEMDVGETAIIPLRVINLNSEAVSYTIAVEGVLDFGTFRIDPDSSFTLPSGHDTTRYLAIELEEWAPLGAQTITIIVYSDDGEEHFPISLFIRKPFGEDSSAQLKQAIEVTLILLLFALLIAGGIIAYKKINQEEQDAEAKNKQDASRQQSKVTSQAKKTRAKVAVKKATVKKAIVKKAIVKKATVKQSAKKFAKKSVRGINNKGINKTTRTTSAKHITKNTTNNRVNK